MVSRTNQDRKDKAVHVRHDDVVNATGEVMALEHRLTLGLESLSDKQRRILAFVVAYVRQYVAVYRLRPEHPEYSKHMHRFDRLVLAEEILTK